MSKWDVFVVRDFEQLLGLDEAKVLEMIAAGKLTGEDCVRPSGEQAWRRVATLPAFTTDVVATQPAAPPEVPARPTGSPVSPPAVPPDAPITERATPDVDITKTAPLRGRQTPTAPQPPKTTPPVAPVKPPAPAPSKAPPLRAPAPDSAVIPPATAAAVSQPTEEDADEATEWANADRRTHREAEELDLTAMVDVTFLLVLFFMLTATFSIQKSLAMPEPNPEEKAARQTIVDLDDLRENHIVVTINADNSLLVDQEPVPAEELVTRLQRVMRETGKNELVVVADESAFHETVVLVYDAGNEVGMQRIRLGAAAASTEFE
jgi:biopolymer transport protein ExbD